MPCSHNKGQFVGDFDTFWNSTIEDRKSHFRFSQYDSFITIWKLFDISRFLANQITFFISPQSVAWLFTIASKYAMLFGANKVWFLWRTVVLDGGQSRTNLMVLKCAHPLMRTLQILFGFLFRFIPFFLPKVTAVYLTFIVYASCSAHLSQQDKRSSISINRSSSSNSSSNSSRVSQEDP